jgi:hypothetical protein
MSIPSGHQHETLIACMELKASKETGYHESPLFKYRVLDLLKSTNHIRSKEHGYFDTNLVVVN